MHQKKHPHPRFPEHLNTDLATFLFRLISFNLVFTEPILPHIIRDLDDIPQFLQDDKLKTLQNENTDLSTHTIGRTSSIAVGVIFAAKPFWEFITNPVIGWTVDR